MVLATVLLIVLGAGIILGSEKKFHSFPMVFLSLLTVGCVFGLGYFGSGIIYGRGLEIKKASIRHSTSAEPVKQDTPAMKRTTTDTSQNH
jgi:hypothetical protein